MAVLAETYPDDHCTSITKDNESIQRWSNAYDDWMTRIHLCMRERQTPVRAGLVAR